MIGLEGVRERALQLWLGATLRHPAPTLLVVVALAAGLASFIPRLQLDASGYSLVRSGDSALPYYRSVRERYGADDFLVVAYSPAGGDVFAPRALAEVASLRKALREVEGVQAVITLLDVPLLRGVQGGLAQLALGAPTLESPGTDPALAHAELRGSALYRDLLVSSDGGTTALRVDIKPGAAAGPVVAGVRAILDRAHGGEAELNLAGVPLIVTDMVAYIRHDIRVFGAGVLAIMGAFLAIAFRRARWVFLPLAICALAGGATVGLLALLGWRVTVVSANFLAVVLIITLSLCVHLIVRYEELAAQAGEGEGGTAVLERCMRDKLASSSFTTATTAVAFGSLTASGIGSVADFGWMTVIGIIVGFVASMLAFPAALALLPTARRQVGRESAAAFAGACARLAARRPGGVLVGAAAVAIVSTAGLWRLDTDSRFTDYFYPESDIRRGMLVVDQALGGTTPLDVVLRAPPGASEGYWTRPLQLQSLARAHDFLDGLADTGKVQSLATAMRVLEEANGAPLDDFMLAVVFRRISGQARATLVTPYVSPDGLETRIAVRIYETKPALERDALLRRIAAELPAVAGIRTEDVRLTGMLVLYNDVLESLFRSQATTIAIVFAATMAMFVLMLRSVRAAAVAMVPNMLATAMVLGGIGLAGIPLDVMTIAVAAVVLGIGVDDSIHYMDRYVAERRAGRGVTAAIRATHAAVGRALLYTSLTIACGFAVFALSSFVPTVRFGLLTGLAMFAALLANLLLLPALLVLTRPLRRELSRVAKTRRKGRRATR